MRICNLCSGSKGNCTYIEGENTKILLDAGNNLKYIKESLNEINIELSQIDAILLTHEHNDHIKGLKSIVENYNIDVYCHFTLKDLIEKTISKPVKTFNKDFEINDMHIYPFDLPHDSIHCNGYRIKDGNAHASFLTDLGYMPEDVLNLISGSAFVYLESNYDQSMLFSCNYPIWLKKRIEGRQGHLSNIDCAKTIEKLSKTGTRAILLAHLSENSNTPLLAFNTTLDYLKSKDIEIGTDIRVDISNQYRRSSIYRIR